MTEKEYLARREVYLSTIKNYQREMSELDQKYIEENSLYKVGETVRFIGRGLNTKAEVTLIRLHGAKIYYDLLLYRKDGIIGRRRISSAAQHEVHYEPYES